MKKLTFKKDHAKINYGLSGKIKVLAATALIASASMACTTDDCRTTSTDTGSSSDLGAQQDPNTYCDSD